MFLGESAIPLAGKNDNEEDTIADCAFRSIDSVHLRSRSRFMNINDPLLSPPPPSSSGFASARTAHHYTAIIVSPLITSRVRYLRDSIRAFSSCKKGRRGERGARTMGINKLNSHEGRVRAFGAAPRTFRERPSRRS